MSAPVAIALNGSPSASSRTGTLAQLALEYAGGGTAVHLGTLDAEALLARRTDDAVTEVVRQMSEARLLIVATPVYRATFSALTKTVFDLLPTDALANSVTVPIA